MSDAGHQLLCLGNRQLLGLAVASMAALTYFGAHFAVLGHASSERTSYKAMHRWAFYVGISLAGLLTLGAVLTATATVREAGGLMAVGFLCFALVFCALVQVAFWSFRKPTQETQQPQPPCGPGPQDGHVRRREQLGQKVEDAVLDTYDLVYDQAVKSSSSIWRQELAAIQDTFLCCGKSSPFSLLGSSEADLCRGAEAERQDCLQGIRSFLRTHRNITFTLTAIGLASTVYGMLLSSFLWFTIRAGCSLDRKGRYTLSPGARGCQPQEPSFFRCSQWGPAPQHSSKADALSGRLGPRGHSDGPRLLQGD
ncbi:tetraspanin-32 isoform X2 [Equus asinus]|uniref:tetraspanin-32 isoform X2 n=1 Tax=Equus asinus TaxID=9793 RepID=UPI0038F7CBFB